MRKCRENYFPRKEKIMAKKTVKNTTSTALKAAYAPNRKGIIALANDLLKAGLVSNVDIINGKGEPDLEKGWIWMDVDKETYTERIKDKIPCFSVFFRFSGKRSQYYAGPIMEPTFYLGRAEMIGADIADNGDISASVWTEGQRKEKPKAQKRTSKSIKTATPEQIVSAMTDEQIAAMTKLLKARAKKTA